MWIQPDNAAVKAIKAYLLDLEGDTTVFPAGAIISLYTNNLTPTRNNVIADFTELTSVEVPGYAPVAIAWNGTPIRNQDASWTDEAAQAIFAASGSPPSPQIVYGWFLQNAGKTALLGSGIFASPFTYTQSGDGFFLTPRLNGIQSDGDNVKFDFEMELDA